MYKYLEVRTYSRKQEKRAWKNKRLTWLECRWLEKSLGRLRRTQAWITEGLAFMIRAQIVFSKQREGLKEFNQGSNLIRFVFVKNYPGCSMANGLE